MPIDLTLTTGISPPAGTISDLYTTTGMSPPSTDQISNGLRDELVVLDPNDVAFAVQDTRPRPDEAPCANDWQVAAAGLPKVPYLRHVPHVRRLDPSPQQHPTGDDRPGGHGLSEGIAGNPGSPRGRRTLGLRQDASQGEAAVPATSGRGIRAARRPAQPADAARAPAVVDPAADDAVMASHPVPKPRQQATPYGAVALSARWKRDRYYLLATGPVTALGWLFPHETSFERRSANSVRRTFQPDEQPVTDPVRLDKLMTTWQRAWKARLGDAPLAVAVGPHASDPNAPATLTDLYERFIIAQRGQVAFNTLEKYHCHRARWEEALGRFLPLRDLTPERILNARALIAGKVSATTTNNSLATLKRLLRFAEDEG